MRQHATGVPRGMAPCYWDRARYVALWNRLICAAPASSEHSRDTRSDQLIWCTRHALRMFPHMPN
jgi:hypothetical protein